MLSFNFLKTASPSLYRVYLFRYLRDNVLPVYEEYLRRELRCVNMCSDQRDAITEYCRICTNCHISLQYSEVDLNDIHPVFENMKKHILI